MYSHQTHKPHHFGVSHVPRIAAIPIIIIALLAMTVIQQALFSASVSIPLFNRSQDNSSASAISTTIRYQDAETFLTEFRTTPLSLTLGQVPGREPISIHVYPSDIGITIDENQLREDITSHNRARLVPIAGLFTADTADIADYILIDQDKLSAYAENIHTLYYIAPTDSQPVFAVGSDELTATTSTEGYSYGATQIAKALYDTAVTGVEEMRLSAATINPTVTEAFILEQEATLTKIHNSTITFTDNAHTFTLRGNNQLLTTIEPTTTTGYTFNLDKLQLFLDTWITPQFVSTPDPETTVNTTQLAPLYAKALRDEGTSQPIQITYQQVELIPDTGNSSKQQQLQDVVTKLGQEYGAAISVTQLDGDKLSASYDGGQSRIAASTYKLLVAYAVAQDISNGVSEWSDPTYNRSTRSCLESMIVYSTNHCAQNWVRNEYGYDYMNDLIASLGLVSTCFNCGDYSLSSTNDQLAMMQLFYDADGIDREVADIVLDMLDRSRGESAIPLATGPPHKIYNKIGWVPGHYNDTAIIEFPDATVGLSVYTDYNGWGQIRAITNEITPLFE